MKLDCRLRKDGHRFDESQVGELLSLHTMVAGYVAEVNEAFLQKNTEILTKLSISGKHVRNKINELRGKHLEMLSVEQMAPAVGVAFMALLNSYARVRDHAKNIAEAIAGEK